MNDTRRREIRGLVDEANELAGKIRSVAEEEDEYRDNMPESLIGSERYDASSTASDNLNDAAGSIESAIEQLEEAAE